MDDNSINQLRTQLHSAYERLRYGTGEPIVVGFATFFIWHDIFGTFLVPEIPLVGLVVGFIGVVRLLRTTFGGQDGDVMSFDEWASDGGDTHRNDDCSKSPIHQSVKEQRPEGGYEQPSGPMNAGVAIVLLLFIGIVIAGAGIGMSDTTQVDKQACIEESYDGECVEYGSIEYTESEQDPMKPLAIGIGGIMVIGAIVIYGVK